MPGLTPLSTLESGTILYFMPFEGYTHEMVINHILKSLTVFEFKIFKALPSQNKDDKLSAA